MGATLKKHPIEKIKKNPSSISKKLLHAKFDSNRLSSFRDMDWYIQTDRQTDRHPDNFSKLTFLDSWGLKTCKSTEISRSNFQAITKLSLVYYVALWVSFIHFLEKNRRSSPTMMKIGKICFLKVIKKKTKNGQNWATPRGTSHRPTVIALYGSYL